MARYTFPTLIFLKAVYNMQRISDMVRKRASEEIVKINRSIFHEAMTKMVDYFLKVFFDTQSIVDT